MLKSLKISHTYTYTHTQTKKIKTVKNNKFGKLYNTKSKHTQKNQLYSHALIMNNLKRKFKKHQKLRYLGINVTRRKKTCTLETIKHC